MLNPALIAAVLAATTEGHKRESGADFPWVMSFIAAPMVLHNGTRRALPTTTRTHLATWVSRNPILHSGFPERASGLVGPVRTGLRFGLSHDVLRVQGEALVSNRRRRPRGFQAPTELDEILRKANLVGRWLSKTGSPATVLPLLGVAP